MGKIKRRDAFILQPTNDYFFLIDDFRGKSMLMPLSDSVNSVTRLPNLLNSANPDDPSCLIEMR